jgi:peptidoglycan/xylan/chitin deacetylase (PgdA/CDA1 family)
MTADDGRRAVSEVLVLAYHAVSAEWRADLSITPQKLEWQLRSLTRRGYRGATVHEAVCRPAAGKTVAVTFDDGYRSVLTLGAPILRRYGIPGTVFVPTDFMGAAEPMRWPGIDHWLDGRHDPELLPLTWSELAELAAAGWEVGSHTRSHPRLTQVDDASLEAELRESRQVCERELRRPCRSLAYPYGDHDPRVVAAARTAGYDVACTLPEEFSAGDPLRTSRTGIYHGDSDLMFRIKTSPWTTRGRRSRAWRPVSRAVRRARGR